MSWPFYFSVWHSAGNQTSQWSSYLLIRPINCLETFCVLFLADASNTRQEKDFQWFVVRILYLVRERVFCFNSLAPGKFECNFRYVIFKRILVIAGWGISCEIALIWTSLDLTDDQPTLVQVMAWRHQATSHYLSQCWPRSLSPYGVTRP